MVYVQCALAAEATYLKGSRRPAEGAGACEPSAESGRTPGVVYTFLEEAQLKTRACKDLVELLKSTRKPFGGVDESLSDGKDLEDHPSTLSLVGGALLSGGGLLLPVFLGCYFWAIQKGVRVHHPKRMRTSFQAQPSLVPSIVPEIGRAMMVSLPTGWTS